MKKRFCSLALALALSLSLSGPALAAEGDLFTATATMPGLIDVSQAGPSGGDWYDYASIKICVEAGLMKGSGMCFNPGDAISMAEVATVAARIYEKTSGKPLPEAAQGDPWYAGAVSVMETLGIPMPADPLTPATRSDFVAMLAAVVPGSMLTAINTITTLPDSSDADVLRFYNAGIVTGSDKYGSFTGSRGLTRAETAAMLARVVRPSLRKSLTLEEKPAPTGDPAMDLLGVAGDTTIFTVDGYAVTAQEYLYWLAYTTNSIGYYNYGSAADIDWDAEADGQTVSAFIKESAQYMAVLYRVAETEAAKAGVLLTQTDLASIDQALADLRAEVGEKAFQTELRSLCITEAGYRSLMETSYLFAELKNHLFASPNQKEVDAYAAEVGTLRAKHILIADKAQAQKVLTQLRAAGNSEAKFDALMAQYSEDGRDSDGKLAAPDGYVFYPGDMVQAFEDGTKALKVGQVSGLVESQYGYHIILRLAVRPEDVQEDWSSDRINAFMDEKVTAADIKTTALYDSLSPEAVWTAASAY